jgi:prepilin peptidase CpaA
MQALDSHQLAVLVVGALACWHDIRTRHIPNAVTLGGAVVAVAFALTQHGGHGLLASVLGWATGLALFLPFFALGGMGAGDVKLMACVGAWLGPAAAAWAALYTSIAGGVLALATALATGYLRQAVDNTLVLVMFWRTAGIQPLPELTLGQARGPRLAYAVPITVGAAAAMWWR